ncbi:hypothetical protein OsJ_15122 [Oryza sativa Japonica Group]|uniref:HMA domain-containing protein n=1 Tax=Oryza sativa subsp. japonica TaxID=39947 RepID=B9FFM2_ORYSJ|nr:hypothetical protein OsJ_15122 [Oryza sativa Japonica Group]
MKQKMVIKVSMPCGKCRSKAMALVAGATGVSSVEVTGDGKDRLQVVGDGVDPVCVVNRLRKKIGHAEIVQVEEVKEKKPDLPKKPDPPKPEPPKPPVAGRLQQLQLWLRIVSAALFMSAVAQLRRQ